MSVPDLSSYFQGIYLFYIGVQVGKHCPHQSFFPPSFNIMFQLPFSQVAAKNRQEQHEKFKKVMRPFFSFGFGVMVDFHEKWLVAGFWLVVTLNL